MYEEWWTTVLILLVISGLVRACLYYNQTRRMRFVYLQQQQTDQTVVPIMVQPGYVYGSTIQQQQQQQPGPYPYAQPGACYSSAPGAPVMGVPMA